LSVAPLMSAIGFPQSVAYEVEYLRMLETYTCVSSRPGSRTKRKPSSGCGGTGGWWKQYAVSSCLATRSRALRNTLASIAIVSSVESRFGSTYPQRLQRPWVLLWLRWRLAIIWRFIPRFEAFNIPLAEAGGTLSCRGVSAQLPAHAIQMLVEKRRAK
jgi:hypothetical protein